jgi:hypothetical protein
MVADELADCTNYPNNTKNQSINPARATMEAVSTTNVDGDQKKWDEKDELGNRNPATRVKLHGME